MRNLWLLLQRHAFLLAFVALMGLSLSVLVRHDGSARSSWFAATGGSPLPEKANACSGRTTSNSPNRMPTSQPENARLRSQLLSMEMAGTMDRATRHRVARTARFIGQGARMGFRPPWRWARPGDRQHPSATAVLSNGVAIGTVVDVGERFTRILPMLNTAGTWSCRIGRNGAVAPSNWDGRDASRFQMSDVPRYASAEAGDTIYTSGFDLRFPDGIPVGTVLEPPVKGPGPTSRPYPWFPSSTSPRSGTSNTSATGPTASAPCSPNPCPPHDARPDGADGGPAGRSHRSGPLRRMDAAPMGRCGRCSCCPPRPGPSPNWAPDS